MTRYTVMLCCNDERGAFTGRVTSVNVEDHIHLEHEDRGNALRFIGGPNGRVDFIKVGRELFDASRHMTCVGNVFWDAVGIDEVAAKRLVEHLLALGWSITEQACDGPFAGYTDKAVGS